MNIISLFIFYVRNLNLNFNLKTCLSRNSQQILHLKIPRNAIRNPFAQTNSSSKEFINLESKRLKSQLNHKKFKTRKQTTQRLITQTTRHFSPKTKTSSCQINEKTL